jgi:hypothetical protein
MLHELLVGSAGASRVGSNQSFRHVRRRAGRQQLARVGGQRDGAQETQALLQVPDAGAGEGVPLQRLRVQAEAVGVGAQPQPDGAPGEDLVPEPPHEEQEEQPAAAGAAEQRQQPPRPRLQGPPSVTFGLLRGRHGRRRRPPLGPPPPAAPPPPRPGRLNFRPRPLPGERFSAPNFKPIAMRMRSVG